MGKPVLFHGTSMEKSHGYEYISSIPINWTSGPLFAMTYALTYSYPLSGASDNLPKILVYRDWNEEYFNSFTKVPFVLNHEYPLDEPFALWASVIKSPFHTTIEKDNSIETYELSDMERFVEEFIAENSKSRLLELIGNFWENK
jgi:hypothetical protein